MNTNSNIYTVIYTTLIVVIVAAVLAFVAMTLKPKQTANIKAETISQMLVAAQYASKDELGKLSNEQILAKYSENIKAAFLIDANGTKIRDLETEGDIELWDNLKAQNYNIKGGSDVELPVYIFDNNGADVYVVPVYGAGLWGPIWGYIAFDGNCDKILGAYFDHESETPGLGAKIKDELWFREQFAGENMNYDNPDNPFDIVKGGAPKGDLSDSQIDAIAGATMTCNGLNAAIDTWIKAYIPFLSAQKGASIGDGCCGDCCGDGSCGGECNGECENHNNQVEE